MVKKKKVLITGAGSGIGYSFVKHYSWRGYSLVAVSKDLMKLENLRRNILRQTGTPITIFGADFRNENEIEALFEKLSQINFIPDIVINNAGAGWYNNFSNTDYDKISEIIQININSLTKITGKSIQLMKHNNSGAILNVASTLALRPSPNYAVYSATKAYVLSLGKSLRTELKNEGIQISTLIPGRTKTNFQSNAGEPENKLKGMNPDIVAGYAVRQLERNRHIIVPGFTNKLKYIFYKLFL